MASSLRGTSTGEPRETRDALAAVATAYVYATSTPSPQRVIAASKAPQILELRSAPLDHVDVPVSIGIERGERRLEARRDQQVLQVFVAAVDKELDHFLVILHL